MIMCPRWSGQPDEGKGAGEWLVGHLPESGGDVGVSGGAELVDREAAEGGHVFGAVPGVDLGGVLGEGGVADEVEPVLDGPLRSDDLRESLRGCLAAGQVGDDVDRLTAALAGREASAVPDNAGDLGGMREVEIVDGQGLHHAGSSTYSGDLTDHGQTHGLGSGAGGRDGDRPRRTVE